MAFSALRHSTRVLVVDDSLLLAELLCHCLNNAGFQAHLVPSYPEAIEAASSERPNVLILGLDLTAWDQFINLRRASPKTAILTIAGALNARVHARALRAGSLGVICRRTGLAQLIQAIEEVHGGGTWVDPHVAREMALSEPMLNLTEREREILTLLGNAFGNKQIAFELRLSPNTVRNRLQGLYEKFGVRDRAELLKIAYLNGLLRPPWSSLADQVGQPQRDVTLHDRSSRRRREVIHARSQ